MHRIDSAGATADNKFTEGDAATGVAATVVTDDWLNATQEEIAHVIEQTGGTLDKLSNAQLWAALSGWFAKGVQATETVLGIAKVATQAQTDAGTDDATIVSPKKLRWGFSISKATNGYLVLPSWLGGIVFQWGKATVADISTVVDITVSYPLAFTAAPYVFAQDVSQQFVNCRLGSRTINNFVITAQETDTQVQSHTFDWFAIGW